MREYLPDLANKLDIFRPLLKKDVMFQWLPTHQETLDSIKDDIVKATNLYPFDESSPVTIQTDASNVGLGCCLMQRDKPVAFASRGLTETETQYPPIVKECLGIVFACKKFHYFIYGKEVKIITDSKPLVSLFDKPLAKISSSQLLRLRKQVLDYDLKVSYRPGKFMHVPDTLSRAPIPWKPEDKLRLDKMVHSFTVDSISSSENEKIRKETEKDPILSRALAFNRAGWPASKKLIDPQLYQMYNLRYDLQEIDGCLYKTDRLIIPKSCQNEYLKQLHAGHLSANTCKQKARTSIYWHNIDRDID